MKSRKIKAVKLRLRRRWRPQPWHREPALQAARRALRAAHAARWGNLNKSRNVGRILNAMMPVARALLAWKVLDKRQHDLDRRATAARKAYRAELKAARARSR